MFGPEFIRVCAADFALDVKMKGDELGPAQRKFVCPTGV